MTDSHLCVIRWCLHTVPEDLEELLFNLFVTPRDCSFNKQIDYNAEPLAAVACNLFQGFTPQIRDYRRFRPLRYSIPNLECLNGFHRR